MKRLIFLVIFLVILIPVVLYFIYHHQKTRDYSCVNNVCVHVGKNKGKYFSNNCDDACGKQYLDQYYCNNLTCVNAGNNLVCPKGCIGPDQYYCDNSICKNAGETCPIGKTCTNDSTCGGCSSSTCTQDKATWYCNVRGECSHRSACTDREWAANKCFCSQADCITAKCTGSDKYECVNNCCKQTSTGTYPDSTCGGACGTCSSPSSCSASGKSCDDGSITTPCTSGSAKEFASSPTSYYVLAHADNDSWCKKPGQKDPSCASTSDPPCMSPITGTVLHGLWPNYDPPSTTDWCPGWPQYCTDGAEPLLTGGPEDDAKIVSVVQQVIREVQPNYTNVNVANLAGLYTCMNSAKTEVQGRHEFNKHGSASGLTMHDYFTKAISLAADLASRGEFNPGPTTCYDKNFNKITCPESAMIKYTNEMQSKLKSGFGKYSNDVKFTKIDKTIENDKLWRQYWGFF